MFGGVEGGIGGVGMEGDEGVSLERLSARLSADDGKSTYRMRGK